jgi:6-phosphogluconolactonase (cycloisomerase 2 family)
VWIDDSGTATDTSDTGHDGEMDIVVDGHTYTAEENMDLNHDGSYDTVRMDNADGTITAYVDTNGDGRADEYLHTDTQGNVVQDATYDSATGQWVAAHDTGTGDGGTQTAHSGDMTADTPDGTVDVGPATVDTNNDGTADTAVVTDSQGDTVMFTDVDGDGKADIETVVTPTGETHVYDHTGPGQWTETSGGGGVSPDSDQLWGGAGHTVLEGVVKIDSATGQWISQN